MLPLATSAGDIANYALSFFLAVVGLTLAYVFVRLAGVLQRVTSLLGGVEKEIVPVIHKAGGSIDRVNDQLDKLDVVTDSAVSIVATIDTVLRVVASVFKLPAQKLSSWTSGLAHGFATLRTEHDLSAALAALRFAAEERDSQFEEEFAAEAPETAPGPEE